MVAWQIWLIVAGISFVIEALTIGFLVFWFGIAALITAGISLFIPEIMWLQATIFIILSGVLIFFSRKFAKKINKNDNNITNSQSVIGQIGIVTKKIDVSNQIAGQVKVLSETWTAVCNEKDVETLPEGTKVKIKNIDGVKIVVTPIESE